MKKLTKEQEEALKKMLKTLNIDWDTLSPFYKQFVLEIQKLNHKQLSVAYKFLQSLKD